MRSVGSHSDVVASVASYTCETVFWPKFPADGLTGLYIYAVAATVLSIVVLSLLASVASKLGGEAKINREVD